MPRVDLIQLRGGTAAAWTSTNPILAPREEGIETDTGRRKVGDGVTPWVGLDYNGASADLAVHNAAAGGGDTITLQLSATSVPNSGTKGMRLNRAALGAPVGLTLLTADVPQWDAVTLDYETSDLVIAGSHNTDGIGTFGDQFRLSQQGHGEYGKSVGLQSALRRFAFSSNASDNVLMATLLMLDIQTGSPVLSALNVTLAGNTTARIQKDGKFILGPATSTSSAGVSCHTATVSDLKGALEVNNSGAGGQRYQIIPGQAGVTEGGLTVRDATNGIDRITITPTGTIRFGVAGDIATNSVAGFLRIPTMNGAPSGVPTAYGGDSGGAFVFNRSDGKLHVYINGVGWRGVTLS